MNEYENSGAIVCGIDGSASVFDAVRWAARESLSRKAPLTMVHVLAPPMQRDDVFGAPDVDGDYARDLLRDAKDTAIETVPEPDVTTTVERGRPADLLVAATRTARLMVLGSNGESVLTVMTSGSILLEVVEHAACPIAVVRRYDPERRGAVVIGLGRPETATSDRVVAEGFRAAANRDTDLMGLHANTMVGNLVRTSGRADGVAATVSTFDGSLESFRESYPRVHTSSIHAEGSAALELIALSRSAQLLVLGHRRGRPCGRTLISVLRHAHCPVLVVPHA